MARCLQIQQTYNIEKCEIKIVVIFVYLKSQIEYNILTRILIFKVDQI